MVGLWTVSAVRQHPVVRMLIGPDPGGLAELLGITGATANAALGELQKRKLVTRGYGSIAIPDRPALALFALD